MPGTYRCPAETGFYYLQSRYYDPANHRFINADGYASTGQGIVGTNMFAYCNNNPANYCDESGSYSTYCTLVADSGKNSHGGTTPSLVNCTIGCESFCERYMNAFYEEDVNKYGSIVSGGSTYTHTTIEYTGRYTPKSTFEYVAYAVIDFGKSELVAIGIAKAFSGMIGTVISLAVGVYGAIETAINASKSHPEYSCSVYRVTISNTFYDFGTRYYRHTTVSTNETVLYYGIEDGTSNIYLLYDYSEG